MQNYIVNEEDLKEKSELVEKANRLSPQFESTNKALSSFLGQLEVFSSKYNLSIEELILKAESSIVYNEDFFKVLSLAKKISFLKTNQL